MATTHYVGLKYGSTEVSLVGDGVILEDYPITAARLGPGGMYEAVNERLQIAIEGASTGAAQSKYATIGRLLSTVAERRTSGEGEPLYLEVQAANESMRYRAEILDAWPNPENGLLQSWPNALFSYRLTLTREPFFWGTRTQIPLSNVYGSNNTAGLRIDNRQSGSYDAYVDIDASDVLGELPTPAEIWLQNDDATSRGYRSFHIGVNARSNPSSLVPILEAESAGGATKTNYSATNASNGNMTYWAINGANTQITATWTIPATWAEAFRGRYVRLLMKVGTVQSRWVVRPKIMERYGLQTIFQADPVILEDDGLIYDLGTVPIPPVGYTSNLADQVFALDMYHDGSQFTNSYLEADYIFFMPTDSGRTIIQRGMTIPASDYMIFDEIERIWVSYEDSLKHPIYSPRGPGVMLFPGVDQRLWLFHNRGSTNSEGSDLKSIQIWHRPRRLTV